ncbi:MAG: dioxygenase [Porticoccaceae bacterium]|nr:dioxygenase [Porticoccaceae bacterium]
MSSSFFEITEKCIGSSQQFDNTQDWIYELDNPYLHGAYAPTTDEIVVNELEVVGELPDDLFGAFYRNGPNPVFKPKNLYHPFDGDGMVHAVYIRDGKASYRNSYIHTAALQHELAEHKAVWPGVMGPFDFSLPDFPIKDTGNTDVIVFNGKLIPTWYNAGVPYEMNPLTLENQGVFDVKDRTRRNMSAHSHVDWNTGELIFMDYGDEAPFMTYGVANPDGTLRHEVEIDLPGPRLPHDIGFSANYTILHDLPFFHDLDVLRNHNMRVLHFHRDIPTRFGIIPRYGQTTDVRWFECEPCFILHVSNCWEEGDWVVMDGCRSTNPMPTATNEDGALSHMLAYMRLEANNYRWRFNLVTGEVRESDIDDLNTEFNKINQIYNGVKSKYAYHQRIPLLEEGGHTLRFNGVVKYNNDTGQSTQWDYGDGVYGSETPFAPVKGANRESAEDHGYIISLVTDSHTWTSELHILDAQDIAQGPIARIKMPHRVPLGFHAWWSRGEDLWK